MNSEIPNGTERSIDGRLRVYYDGYWIKAYPVPADTLFVKADNPLMRECGRHLSEALDLGKMVRHRSGDEGIDELWGEPFKAFAFPIEEFYKSRYVKLALTMRAIDRVADQLSGTFAGLA